LQIGDFSRFSTKTLNLMFGTIVSIEKRRNYLTGIKTKL